MDHASAKRNLKRLEKQCENDEIDANNPRHVQVDRCLNRFIQFIHTPARVPGIAPVLTPARSPARWLRRKGAGSHA
jgi:hypothetical protein